MDFSTTGHVLRCHQRCADWIWVGLFWWSCFVNYHVVGWRVGKPYFFMFKGVMTSTIGLQPTFLRVTVKPLPDDSRFLFVYATPFLCSLGLCASRSQALYSWLSCRPWGVTPICAGTSEVNSFQSIYSQREFMDMDIGSKVHVCWLDLSGGRVHRSPLGTTLLIMNGHLQWILPLLWIVQLMSLILSINGFAFNWLIYFVN